MRIGRPVFCAVACSGERLIGNVCGQSCSGNFQWPAHQGTPADDGVEKYVWRTLADERVLLSHQDVDGETFSWDLSRQSASDFIVVPMCC